MSVGSALSSVDNSVNAAGNDEGGAAAWHSALGTQNSAIRAQDPGLKTWY
jgi:hypothetical protein